MNPRIAAAWLLSLACVRTTEAQVDVPKQEAGKQHTLMPVPASFEFKPGRLAVDESFAVAVEGHSDERLRAAIERATRRLERRTGLTFARGLASGPAGATLVILCQGPGQAVPSLEEDESYTLDVTGLLGVMRANTVVGALRGLETFLQLLSADRQGYHIPAGNIQDAPRFRWRGLLVDVGRHFQPMEVLKRNLDAMAAVKLNVFHWHLTDDQGFRIESKKYPKLHEMGSDGLFYSQEQAREIIAYARDRGIRVLPEFDMPGHTTAWFVGHPEIAAAPGPYQIERGFGVWGASMDPTRDEVYEFLDNFIGDMAALFPDAYLHIGGDENNGKQWDASPQIQQFKKKNGIPDNHALQTYFNRRLSQILARHGKKMMGWDEVLHPDLPPGVVIQSWRGPQSLLEAARQGHDGVLSNGYYIDLLQPAAKHYAADPVPPDHGLSEEQLQHILGGEATMWSELVSAETIDSRIWPRTAAIAERLWSPRDVTDVDDMYRRLDAISVQLEDLGLTHNKNPEMLLRRIAGTPEIGPLRTLAAVLEPVKGYDRHNLQKPTQFTPLTHLVDATVPDSAAARHFSAQVEAMLRDVPHFRAQQEPIRAALAEWVNVWPGLASMIEKSPLLQEAEPLARDLSAMGTAGLEALHYLSAGSAPPPGWKEARHALLAQAAKSKAAVEFAVILPMRKLIFAAAEVPQLQNSSPEQWRTRVRSLAAESKPKK